MATTSSSPQPIESMVVSLQNLARTDSRINWGALDKFVKDKRQLDYKNWEETSQWAEELKEVIGSPDDEEFQCIFERVLKDGGWYEAQQSCSAERPWIVLVTGLNGVRKTTSLHQPWFKAVLAEALGDSFQPEDPDLLPTGGNSFYRQLDYLIATLANEEFRELYGEAARGLSTSSYSSKKDGIFKRNRTLAEILGVLLLRSAQRKHMNALIETSGRDISSFNYVDTIFAPFPEYRKLALHFVINDIRFAEQSVDARMATEMRAGGALAVAESSSAGKRSQNDAYAVVSVNAGGPYGSEVLASVLADAERVWASVLEDKEGTRSDWLKATIYIEGSADPAQWRARAVLPNGSLSTVTHSFQR